MMGYLPLPHHNSQARTYVKRKCGKKRLAQNIFSGTFWPAAGEEMPMLELLKLPVYALRPGDITVATRETVIAVSAGIKTPKNKMDVILQKDDRRYVRVWGRHTTINIARAIR